MSRTPRSPEIHALLSSAEGRSSARQSFVDRWRSSDDVSCRRRRGNAVSRINGLSDRRSGYFTGPPLLRRRGPGRHRRRPVQTLLERGTAATRRGRVFGHRRLRRLNGCTGARVPRAWTDVSGRSRAEEIGRDETASTSNLAAVEPVIVDVAVDCDDVSHLKLQLLLEIRSPCTPLL